MKKYHKIQTVYKRDPETRFKTLIEGDFSTPELEYLKNNIWIFTEKVDGTNIRVIWDGNSKLRFGGKTENSQIPTFLLDRLMDILPIDLFAGIFEDPITLYGEGCGVKIQKGGENYMSHGVDFILFDVKIGDYWLRRKDIKDVAHKLDLRTVPIIGQGTLSDMVNMARDGIKSCWGDFQAEGIVARPEIELLNRDQERIITKVKTKDFIFPDK